MHHLRIICLAIMAGFIALSASAQNRFIGANKFILDDGLGHTLTLQMSTPTLGGTLTLPGSGGTLTSILAGTVTGQTLYWNNGPKDWEASSIFTNDGVSQLGFTGQLTGTSAAPNYSASISNTNASSSSALTVNQGGSTLPSSSIYPSAGIVSAGSRFGVIGTASNPLNGAGIYGAIDNLSSNNVIFGPGAGVEGVSFGAGDGIVAVQQGGTGDAFEAAVNGGIGLAGKFVGGVGITGQLTTTSGAATYASSITNTNATAYSALEVNQNSTMPSVIYANAATISAGTKFGVVGTCSSPHQGAGVYGAADVLSVNNSTLAVGAGVEGISFGVSAGVAATNDGGSGDALVATSFNGSTGNAGTFLGNVGITGQLAATSAVASYTASIANTNVSATEALLVDQGGATLPQAGISYSSAAIIAAGMQYGLIGTSSGPGGAGVYGSNDNLSGNNITTTLSPGVMGVTFGASSAVLGITSGGTGDAITGEQFFGTGLAGHFYGNVTITGNLNVAGTVSKGGGSFKIDDPIDPKNKYLYHSFVESPDMMNIYNGIAVLDASGAATVTMPKWFEALNGDFRYQLTSIGSFAPVYVASEITGNTFSIAGGKAGQKISWQVTGIRHDAFANAHRIPLEVEKAPEDKGAYLHPEAFGKPAEESISLKNAPQVKVTHNGASVK